MSLLHYLHTHAAQYSIVLSAVHCEHGIRGASSEEDARFVRKQCAEWGIPLYFYAADCPALARERKVSLETAARQFRYACFDGLLSEGKADLIATAHHCGDNAETVLFHISRGASLTGAAGISDRTGYIRPFLPLSEADIVRYAEENGIAYRTDESNTDERFTRNALRLRVLPVLEEIVPGAGKNISRFSRLAREDDALLYALARPLVREERDGVKVLFSDRAPLFRRACLLALKGMGIGKDYTSAHLSSLSALCSSNNGEEVSMPGNIRAIREYDGITFYRSRPAETREIPFALGSFCLAGRRFCVEACPGRGDGEGLYAALSRIPASAVFRTRRAGDVFCKFGGGEKKLKDFLIDRKIPRRVRDGLILLAEGREILAVLGVEISEKLRVNDGDPTVRLYLTEEEPAEEKRGEEKE